jgi:transcriptional regulator with XRE-family HTH domain
MTKSASFAHRLSTARAGLKLTAHALEREAKLSAGTVARLESGERSAPTMPTLIKLAETLSVRIEWLATGKGKRAA